MQTLLPPSRHSTLHFLTAHACAFSVLCTINSATDSLFFFFLNFSIPQQHCICHAYVINNRWIPEWMGKWMNETKWPHSTWRICVNRCPHVRWRKSPSPIEEQKTQQLKRKFLESKREQTAHQLHILLPPQETHLPFSDSKITELYTEEEQALLLYLLSQICHQIPLKLWLF